MTHRQRQLRKLEATIKDSSGLVPHTPEWLDYWAAKIDRAMEGDSDCRPIPLEIMDAVMARDERGGGVAAGISR